MRLLLASASPRRRELLLQAGIPVDVLATAIDESRPVGLAPVAHAQRLAQAKALAAPNDRVVLAADTVVHRQDELFDKPRDREDARAHLNALSGRWHTVTTAVCVRHGAREDLFHVSTAVRFRTLDAATIDRYLATGEADDKAGAYGIQGLGGALVAELNGSYTNVVGLPLEEVLAALDRAGLRGEA